MALRLNLGCGNHKLEGFINADSQPECHPDQVVNLELFPWPWPDNSAEEVLMSHVLEHLGAATETYFGIIKELYRVCQPNAKITVIVPHPRSDNYLADPTHVRPITAMGLGMFDQMLNRKSINAGDATTPLGIYLGVNFMIESTATNVLEPWGTRFNAGEITEAELKHAAQHYYNVIGDTTFVLRAVK